MKRLLTNLGLCCVSLLFCVLVIEAGLRVAYPWVANYNTEMWRYFAELKKPLFDPELSFVHYPNREGRFYGVRIATNAAGFRDRDFEKTPPEGTTRIALLGDSMAMGWGVPFEETAAKVLERNLNEGGEAFEVINMGTGNYNTVMEAAFFQRHGLAYEPDIVLLLYFANDAEPVPRVSRGFYPVQKRSYLLALLFDVYTKIRPGVDRGFHWSQYYQALYDPGSEALAANRAALADLAALCGAEGIQLVVASLPDLHQFDPYPLEAATQYIRGEAESLGLPFIDLFPVLSQEAPATLWVSPEDTHANAKANALIAEGLARHLEE